MSWTDEMVSDLRKMWDEGLTTGEIGKRLGVSKNSIVGKVHRLKLSSRPSPIKKKGEANKDKALPQTPPKEAPKAEEKTPSAKELATKEPVREKEKKTFSKPSDTKKEENIKIEPITCAPQKKPSKWISLTDLDNHTCRWPIGDPKDENFHFCGKKVRLGQTYCDEHASIAYVKTTKK